MLHRGAFKICIEYIYRLKFTVERLNASVLCFKNTLVLQCIFGQKSNVTYQSNVHIHRIQCFDVYILIFTNPIQLLVQQTGIALQKKRKKLFRS